MKVLEFKLCYLREVLASSDFSVYNVLRRVKRGTIEKTALTHTKQSLSNLRYIIWRKDKEYIFFIRAHVAASSFTQS